jgi:hypothetical protein
MDDDKIVDINKAVFKLHENDGDNWDELNVDVLPMDDLDYDFIEESNMDSYIKITEDGEEVVCRDHYYYLAITKYLKKRIYKNISTIKTYRIIIAVLILLLVIIGSLLISEVRLNNRLTSLNSELMTDYLNDNAVQ